MPNYASIKNIKKPKIKIEALTSRTGDDRHMMEKQIKNLAWNTFKQTGNINTFMELVEVENIKKEEKINNTENIKETQNGNYQNEGNNHFRK